MTTSLPLESQSALRNDFPQGLPAGTPPGPQPGMQPGPGMDMAHPVLAPVSSSSQALSAAEAFAPASRLEAGGIYARLPVEVDISVPVRNFRVRNLLALAAGQVIETHWPNGEDLPMAAGEVQLAWSEFEVVDTRLAARVTRLA